MVEQVDKLIDWEAVCLREDNSKAGAGSKIKSRLGNLSQNFVRKRISPCETVGWSQNWMFAISRNAKLDEKYLICENSRNDLVKILPNFAK
jgi:hypothetical protein